jgi:hypothetical protein
MFGNFFLSALRSLVRANMASSLSTVPFSQEKPAM